MAEVDLHIQSILLVIICIFVVGKSIHKIWSICHRYVFAFFLGYVLTPYVEKGLAQLKTELFKELPDVAKTMHVDFLTILELGIGAGPNLKFYPKGTVVLPVDPNPYFNKYLEANKRGNTHVEVKPFIECYGEDMTAFINDCSVDAVVCSLTLCTVSHVKSVLQEVRRVLKPGGKFYFLEHVSAERGTWLRYFQQKIAPFWRVCGDGCNPDRETWLDIDRAGFSHVQHKRIQRRSLNIPFTLLIGLATK